MPELVYDLVGIAIVATIAVVTGSAIIATAAVRATFGFNSSTDCLKVAPTGGLAYLMQDVRRGP
jgi:hypothetical protein